MASNERRTVLNGKFLIVEDGHMAECTYCKAKLKYHHSTSSLAYHLKSRHPFSSDSESKSSLNDQPSITTFFKRVSTSHEFSITKSICYWIAHDLRPVSIVDDIGLQALLREATGDKEYKLPSRTAITEKLTDLYQSKRSLIQSQIDDAFSVCIIIDYWSSLKQESYMGAQAVFVDKSWVLKSLTLGLNHTSEAHTGESIASQIKELLEKWSIPDSKVKYICSDNASNMIKAIRLTQKIHIPCMAHTLQLSINHAMKEAHMDRLLSKCRKIVGHFKHSPTLTAALSNTQKAGGHSQLRMVQDVSTRWGSSLQMVSRLLENKQSLMECLDNCDLTEAEWDKLMVYKKLLLPCEKATTMLGGEKYVTSSIVLPLMCYLRREMTSSEDDPGYARTFKEAFYADIISRIGTAADNAVLQIATALDVRFKMLKCMPKDKRENVWQLIKNLMNDISEHTDSDVPEVKKPRLMNNSMFTVVDSDDDDDNDADEVEDGANLRSSYELTLYRSIPAETDVDKDPLIFWKANENTYPILSQLARQYLGVPATSVTVERLFSTAGNLITVKRNALEPQNANMLNSLHC